MRAESPAAPLTSLMTFWAGTIRPKLVPSPIFIIFRPPGGMSGPILMIFGPLGWIEDACRESPRSVKNITDRIVPLELNQVDRLLQRKKTKKEFGLDVVIN